MLIQGSFHFLYLSLGARYCSPSQWNVPPAPTSLRECAVGLECNEIVTRCAILPKYRLICIPLMVRIYVQGRSPCSAETIKTSYRPRHRTVPSTNFLAPHFLSVMAVLQFVRPLDATPSLSNVLLALIAAVLTWSLCSALYNVYFHPLARFPGPKLAAASKYWLFYQEFIRGISLSDIRDELHAQYGTLRPFLQRRRGH